jgi:hypothetical protein
MKGKLEVQVGLSAKGLANVSQNICEADLTFIVGDDKYQCPLFIAAFLSPRGGQFLVNN